MYGKDPWKFLFTPKCNALSNHLDRLKIDYCMCGWHRDIDSRQKISCVNILHLKNMSLALLKKSIEQTEKAAQNAINEI